MPTSYHIDVQQQNDWSATLTATGAAGTTVNLSGYSVSGHVRARYGSTGSSLYDLRPTVLNAGAGTISLNLLASGLATLPVGVFCWNMTIASGSVTTQTHAGKFTVSPSVLF